MTPPRRLLLGLVLSLVLALPAVMRSSALEGTDPPVVDSSEAAIALGGRLPDVMEEYPKHLGVQNAGQKEVLRFSTTHWNFGDGPLQIRGGGEEAPCTVDGISTVCTFAIQEILDASGEVVAVHPAGVALFHPEHDHWHQSGVAEFAVRASPAGPPVAARQFKTTFCLVDFEASKVVGPVSTRQYFECNAEFQGISVGWGDEYHHATEGQGIEITGLPAGVYYLTHVADPEQHWLETNEANNVAWTKFRLSRKGANASIVVLETYGYAGNTSNK